MDRKYDPSNLFLKGFKYDIYRRKRMKKKVSHSRRKLKE